MQELDDSSLLREYAERASEEAFATLVARHIDKVYSVALRHTGNPHRAEEITQAVFVILAKKSAHLRRGVIVSGWLYETARLTAITFLRSEIRRSRREQEAFMQTLLNEDESDLWRQIGPLLDAGMAGLNEKDRHAVVLRFFDGKSMSEVGAALGANEDAAKKRVGRALGKLRAFFTKRGVTSTTVIIAGALSANSVQAAPVGLAKSVTAAAVAKGTVAGGSAVALAHGVMKMMAWAKLQFACCVGAAVVLAGGTIAFVAVETTESNDRYQIEGTLVYNSGAFTRDFTLTVNGSNWMIHLVDQGADSGQYSEEVCLNGSVYSYSHVGKPDPTGHVVNNAIANIDYGQSAVEDSTFAEFAWVGLASGSYFSSRTNDQVTPMFQVNNARDYRTKAQWQLYESPPHLPKSIDYYVNPGQQLYGHRSGEIVHQFDNGWKEGEVRVQQETNIDGKTFPTAYVYEQFRPNVDEPILTNAVEHQFFVTVNVRAIRLDSVPDVVTPKADGGTMMSENRFPKIKGRNQTIGYLSKAARLPESPEAEAVKEYKFRAEPRSRAARNQRVELKPAADHRWIWVSAFLIVLAGAGITKVVQRRSE